MNLSVEVLLTNFPPQPLSLSLNSLQLCAGFLLVISCICLYNLIQMFYEVSFNSKDIQWR